MNAPDNIIIVDTVQHRAEFVEAVLGTRHAIDIILLDPFNPEPARASFEERFGELLAQRKIVMVISDVRSAVKGRIVETMREVESRRSRESRRIIMDCTSPRKLNRIFKENGVTRQGMRHVVYTGNDEIFARRIHELFCHSST